jgi:hypothetical protein
MRPRPLTGGRLLSALRPARSLPLCPVGLPRRRLAHYALARLCRCPKGPACQSLSPPSTIRSHRPRARTAETATPASPPSTKPSSRPPLQVHARINFPCLIHFAPTHSPELRTAVLQACRSSPIARPPAPESAPSKVRSASLTVLRHRQTKLYRRLRLTRGEFPRRTSPSLSPVFSVPSIICRWSPVTTPHSHTKTPPPNRNCPVPSFARVESSALAMALALSVRPRKTIATIRGPAHQPHSVSHSTFPSRRHWPVDPLIPCVSTACSIRPALCHTVAPPSGPRPPMRTRHRAHVCPALLTSGPDLAMARPVRRQRPGTQSFAHRSRWPMGPSCQASAPAHLRARPASSNHGHRSEI